jgi:hypothetical protein
MADKGKDILIEKSRFKIQNFRRRQGYARTGKIQGLKSKI